MSVVFALATPASRSALCVFRVTGAGCLDCLPDIFNLAPEKPRTFYNRLLVGSDGVIDSVGVVFFEGSNSYTGEDSFEVFAHGGLAIMNSIVGLFEEIGFDEAGPGEFTKRSFLNDKLSLSQAESVSDAINATRKDVLKVALNSLAGGFAAEVFGFADRVDGIRKFVEGSIDFSDEDYDFINDGGVVESLEVLCADFGGFVSSCYVSAENESKKSVLFVGPPNSGKSSLFNRLLGFDRALVSDSAGTTRDLIESEVFYNNSSFGIIDSAGIRKTEDKIEKDGVELALGKIKKADVVVAVFDSEDVVMKNELAALALDKPFLTVLNKIDLDVAGDEGVFDFALSAKTGAGISDFKNCISNLFKHTKVGDQKYFARSRHVRLFDSCLTSLQDSMIKIKAGEDLDLAAEDLRLARVSLDDVVGVKTSDSLLGDIFNDFCIGK